MPPAHDFTWPRLSFHFFDIQRLFISVTVSALECIQWCLPVLVLLQSGETMSFFQGILLGHAIGNWGAFDSPSFWAPGNASRTVSYLVEHLDD